MKNKNLFFKIGTILLIIILVILFILSYFFSIVIIQIFTYNFEDFAAFFLIYLVNYISFYFLTSILAKNSKFSNLNQNREYTDIFLLLFLLVAIVFSLVSSVSLLEIILIIIKFAIDIFLYHKVLNYSFGTIKMVLYPGEDGYCLNNISGKDITYKLCNKETLKKTDQEITKDDKIIILKNNEEVLVLKRTN